jgi:hypothetical protein
MREGPPLWLNPPALAKSAVVPVDDGGVSAEIWAEGIRIFAEGYAEDDSAYDYEASGTYFSLEEAVCLCNTLATGKDTRFEEEAWGRIYTRVFSLDSHTTVKTPHPQRQQIWFYPMNERRLVLRFVVGPLVPALREILQWAEHEAPQVQLQAQGAQNRLLRRALQLLEQATRRIEF